MGSLADNWRECIRRPRDSAVWEDLLDGQRVLIARIAVRVAHRFGVTQVDQIDDAVQEACIKLSAAAREARIPDQENEALEAYLKALIANAVHDYFRKQRAKKRDTVATLPIDEPAGAALQSSDGSDLDSGVLLAQIESFVGADHRERNVFCLYYQQGWTAKEIAAIPSLGLSAKGVESLVFRLTAALRAKVGTADLSKVPPSRKGIQPGGAS